MTLAVEKTKVRPLHDRVLVSRLPESEQMRNGIYIPDAAKEKPQEGVVIAHGRGRFTDDGGILPLDVEDGNRVLFGKYAGTEIKIDGEEFLMMREEEILAIIEQ